MLRFFRQPLRQQGYTFNEILVALAITGIAVLGYSATTISVIRGNDMSEDYTVAVNLAQDKIEQLTAHASLGNEDRCPAAGETAINPRGGAGGIFNRCWKITDATIAPNLKQIEVTVSWGDSEPRSVSLTTLKYRE
jgi:Tfp pilus assembly protein PilV